MLQLKGDLKALAIDTSPEFEEVEKLAVKAGSIKTAEGDQRAIASATLAELATMRREIEKSRKEVKEPILELGRRVDEVAHKASQPIVDEERRLGSLIVLEDRRLKRIAEESARKAEEERKRIAAEQEKERQRILAEQQPVTEFKTAEDIDAEERRLAEQRERLKQIEEETREKQMAVPQVFVPKASHTVKEEIDFDVVDLQLLAHQHPHLVTIEPKRREILALLKAGGVVHGVLKKTVEKVRA